MADTSPDAAKSALARRISSHGLAPVSVAEVAAERLIEEPPEIPWHMTPSQTGRIALQLRSTVRRVAVGAGLARRTELIESVRRLDGVPAVVTSPAGGTFVIGGDAWLGLCAIGVPRPGQPMPLDWMLHSLFAWFQATLEPFGVTPTLGRVDGAWCPGFSDIAVGGRKLVGLGFRVTREWVVMRGVMAVRPMTDWDRDVLVRCHRLIGVDVREGTVISLSEAAALPALTVEDTIGRLRNVVTDAVPETISVPVAGAPRMRSRPGAANLG